MAVVHGGPSLLVLRPPSPVQLSDRRHLQSSSSRAQYCNRTAKVRCLSSNFCGVRRKLQKYCCLLLAKRSRIGSFHDGDNGSSDTAESEVASGDGKWDPNISIGNSENKTAGNSSFLSKLGILLGVAAVITLISVTINPPNQAVSSGIQFIQDGSSPSALCTTPTGFSFQFFGCRVVLPEYAPGWTYFWLLMAAGCGLFISEEALNIWVGITLARLLSLDGTWQAFVESFTRNSPYIISTVIWVYWGVTISDMIPFYLGKLFRRSKASIDIVSKLGVGKEKATKIASSVQKYGNLIGFVERFSIGVRNPTAFLAGAMDVSPECFFAGVCCGGLITLPLQLAVGFLLRERPLVAIATVATAVGIWTVFPYAVAALTAVVYYFITSVRSPD